VDRESVHGEEGTLSDIQRYAESTRTQAHKDARRSTETRSKTDEMTEENSVLKEAEATPVDAGLVMSRKVFALRLGDACPGADPAALKTELLASLEANGAASPACHVG